MPDLTKEKRSVFEVSADKSPHYGLRKLNAGVTSVLLSTTLWMSKSTIAQAATETTASQNSADDSTASDNLKTESGLVMTNSANTDNFEGDTNNGASPANADTATAGQNAAADNSATAENLDGADSREEKTESAQKEATVKADNQDNMPAENADNAKTGEADKQDNSQTKQETSDASKAVTTDTSQADSQTGQENAESTADNVQNGNAASAEESNSDEVNPANSVSTDGDQNARNASAETTAQAETSNADSQESINAQTAENKLDSSDASNKTSATIAVNTSDLNTVSTAKLISSIPRFNSRMLAVSLAATTNKKAHIKSQEDLNKFLAQNGTNLAGITIYMENSDAIKWPSSTYILSGNKSGTKNSHIYFTAQSTGDVDFNGSVFAIDKLNNFKWASMQGDHKGQTIKNAYFYGSTSRGSDGSYIWYMIRAQNQNLTNLHFYNAQRQGTHILDIDGSNNITITNCEFAGYGVGDISDADIKAEQDQRFHNMFAEAVQIDNAKASMNESTTADTTNVDIGYETYRESSTNITIHHNVFTNYRGKTGDAIVNNTNETVYDKYSATGIGQHMMSNSQIAEATGINIYNNVFFKTIPEQDIDSTTKNKGGQTPKSENMMFAPIHEVTSNEKEYGNHAIYTVKKNAFVNLKEGNYNTPNGEPYKRITTNFVGWCGTDDKGNKALSINGDTISAKSVSWNGNTANINTANNSFGPDKMPNDPMPSSSTTSSVSHTVKRTIEYKIQGGNHQAPSSVNDSLTFNGTQTTDKYTGQSSTNWDGNKDFNDVTSPDIQGYTADRKVVSDKNIGHDHADIYEVVTYKADNQKVTIVFHDDTDNKDIKSDNLNGESDTVAYTSDGGWHAYTTEASINDLKSKGYILVSDDTNGKQIMLDHDTGKDQYFVVHLKHDTHAEQVSADVARVITYVMKDGSKALAQVKDTLHFTGTKTVDIDTKQALNTTWEGNKDFNDVATPAVKGYTPDKKSVSDKGISHDHAAISETVTYAPDPQKAIIIFIDQTTGEKLRDDTINGVTHAHSGYTTKDKIQQYLDNGYVLVSDSTNGAEIIYDDEDATDQHFVIVLKHGTQTITEDSPAKPGTAINKNQNGVKYPNGVNKEELSRNVNRTITYVMKDGSKAPAQEKESLHFKLTLVLDKVTGKIISSTWSPNQNFKDVTSPAVKGYTPDQKTVSDTDIAHNSDDIATTVTYTPDPQKAAVTFIDKTTGKTLKTMPLNGVTNAHSGYSTKKDIQNYEDNGYALVSDSSKGSEIIYDNDDAVDQKFTVILEHTYRTLTEDDAATPGTAINKNQNGVKYPEGTDKASLGKDVKREIDYKATDNSQAGGPVISVLHFTAKKVVDKVTGQVISTEWNPESQDFDDALTPSIKGYTADHASVSDKGITHESSDIVKTVSYTPDAQKATVTYIDATTGKTISIDTLSGYSTATEIKTLEKAGYTVISDETNGQQIIFDNEDGQDQSYTVKLAHLVKDSTETHKATRTILLHKPSGVKKIKQTASVTRKVATDMVTGAKTYGAWSTAEWPAYKAPKIKGYKASVEGADGTSKVERGLVTQDTKDQTVTVKYLKDSVSGQQPASLNENSSVKAKGKILATNSETGTSVNAPLGSTTASSANTNAVSSLSGNTGSSSALPSTGNSQDNAVLALGTFEAGASLLMTVLGRRLGRKQEKKNELL